MTPRLLFAAGWLALTAAMAATAMQISQLAGQIADQRHPQPLLPAGQRDPAEGAAAQTREVEALIAAAPFGARPSANALGETESSATNGLILHAVRLAHPETTSTATLSISGGVPQIYRIGNEIGGLATLQRIEARRVIVRIGASEAVVAFPQLSGSKTLPSLYAAKAAEYPVTRTDGSAQSGQSASAIATNTIRAQISENPALLLESLGLEASAEGYFIGANPPPVLIAAGLQPGDKVIKVNGSNVGNASADQILFEQAVASGRARVEVLRAGKTLFLSFPLR